MPDSVLPRLRMFSLLISLACLASCGGDSGAQLGADGPTLPPKSADSLPSADLSGLPTAAPVMLPDSAAVTTSSERGVRREMPGPGALTNIVLQNTGRSDQSGAPVTFGHIFADGHLTAADFLRLRHSDGTVVEPQVDIKARYPSGAVRHAVLTMLAPTLEPGQRRSVDLVVLQTVPSAPPSPAQSPADLLARGFKARVDITLGSRTYSASADALLRSGKYKTWLAGPLVNEWLVSAPLRDADGVAHPHLSARFAIRGVNGSNRARVDVTLENGWAYEPGPQNFTYDAAVAVGDAVVYAKSALTHYHHARWRKVFRWGNAPQVHVRHNTAYLIASRALPNYDPALTISEASLYSLKNGWTGARIEPMGSGMAVPAMPGTGGRPDIGLLPGWAATYLLSMDPRAKEVTMGTADLAGSWSAHYRNKATDRPVTLQDYPYMTILGNPGDTVNPATGKREAFPPCTAVNACYNQNKHDSSHQPGFAYLPYLVSGDHYYLEELQFWTMWNSFSSNPAYRQNVKGLLAADQVRGQAWSLRTLAEAAYITPDSDPLKPQLAALLDHNLNWYNATYSNSASANVLGALTNGAVVYTNGTAVAPWQDDFFTAAVGHALELGFTKAAPLLRYKTRFPILRMTGSGSCWIDGAMYSLVIRDSPTAPFYTDIGRAAVATHTPTFTSLPCAGAEMASFLKLKVGEMTGYSSAVAGYPSNMQPALAFAAEVGGTAGRTAWAQFMARTVKPDYSTGPAFAIVPRPPSP